MATNIHLDTNVRGKIEIYFLFSYSSHFTDKFLRVYCLKHSSLVVIFFFFFFFFLITTFLIFPKNTFNRASTEIFNKKMEQPTQIFNNKPRTAVEHSLSWKQTRNLGGGGREQKK